MVPPTHNSDAGAAGPDWRDRLRLILSLRGNSGLVVLLSDAHDAAVPELIELVREADAHPIIAFSPEVLLEVQNGSLLILVEPGPYGEWLNLHRPVVHERNLSVLLWCSQASVEQLKQHGPDFLDWVSHRIHVPAIIPRYVRDAITACERDKGLLAIVNAPDVPENWRVIRATVPYTELRDACLAGPVWVTDVVDRLDYWAVKLAHTQAGGYGVVVAEPRVGGAGEEWVDGKPVPWHVAAQKLQSEDEPGLTAGLRGLNPQILDGERNGSVIIDSDPRWAQILEFSRRRPDAEAIRLALDLELFGVAAAWVEEAEPSATTRAQRLRVQSKLAWKAGDGPKALELIEQAVEQARAGDEREIADCRFALAGILVNQGYWDEALGILRELFPVYERLGDNRNVARTKRQIAECLWDLGELDRALKIYRDEVLPAFERIGDDRERAITKMLLAGIDSFRGNFEQALEIYQEEVLPVLARTGDVRSQAQMMCRIANIYTNRDGLDQAVHLYQEALLAIEHTGDARDRALTIWQIADVHLARGNLEQALQLIQEVVLPATQGLGDLHSSALVMYTLANIYFARGDLDQAINIYRDEALPIFVRLGALYNRAGTLGDLAWAYYARGDLDQAVRTHREQVPIYQRLGDQPRAAKVLARIAKIHELRGEFDQVICIFRDEVLPIFERLNDVPSQRRTRTTIARTAIQRTVHELRQSLIQAQELGFGDVARDIQLLLLKHRL